MLNNRTMSESIVLNLNTSGIDLSDIKGGGHDVLAIEPKVDKQALKEQKEEAKALARAAREDAKETKRAAKEKTKVDQAAGLFGGSEAQRLRVLICRFRAHKKFGKVLKEQKVIPENKTLDKMDAAQLEDVLNKVRFTVCNLNCGNMYKGIVKTLIETCEKFGSKAGYRIDGLGAALEHQEEYNDLLDEIMIERGILFYTKPEYRLAYLVVSTAISLHSARKVLDTLPEEERKKIMAQYAQPSNQMSVVQPANTPPVAPLTFTEPNRKMTVDDFEKNKREAFANKYADLLS